MKVNIQNCHDDRNHIASFRGYLVLKYLIDKTCTHPVYI